MSEARDLCAALGGDWQSASGLAPCPICQPEGRRDQRALSITEKGGRLLLHCHKGGCAVLPELQRRGLIAGRGAAPGARPDPAEAARRRAKEEEREARRLAAAHRIFDEAAPIPGTVAETYLEEARGIIGPRWAKMARTLRFHPGTLHSASGLHLPAIIAQVRGPHGERLGVHRTYLRPDGSGKADVRPAKAMLGPMASGAVRLGPDAPVIALAEGIETALSIGAASRLTTWATLSTSGLKGLILPSPPVAEVVVICADHDAAGLAAAEVAAERLRAEGRAVAVIHPPAPDADFNDVLRGAK